MKTTDSMIKRIKQWEGFRGNRYLCPAGKPTIGYGHLIKKGEKINEPMSEAAAEELLKQDLETFESEVMVMCKIPPTQNEFDSLVSFAFNLGSTALKNSTLMRYHNAGNKQGAAAQFTRWMNINGKPSNALRKRREVERDRYLGML